MKKYYEVDWTYLPTGDSYKVTMSENELIDLFAYKNARVTYFKTINEGK